MNDRMHWNRRNHERTQRNQQKPNELKNGNSYRAVLWTTNVYHSQTTNTCSKATSQSHRCHLCQTDSSNTGHTTASHVIDILTVPSISAQLPSVSSKLQLFTSRTNISSQYSVRGGGILTNVPMHRWVTSLPGTDSGPQSSTVCSFLLSDFIPSVAAPSLSLVLIYGTI